MLRRLALPLLVLAALLALRATALGAPAVVNDTTQYLSAARSLAERGESATTLVHFDPERAAGRIPAPLTWFPPGYPAAIAALSRARLAPETAALTLAVLSSALVLWLLVLAARAVGLSEGASLLVLLAWAANAQVATLTLHALSELPFTAVVLAAVVLLLADERRPAWWRPVLACLLLGLAYWVRYAGLLLVAGVHVHALLRVARDWRRLTTWALALLACDLVVGLGMLRNLLLSGRWQGGEFHPHQVPLWRLALRTPEVARQLVFGPSRGALAITLALAALAVFAVAARRARRRPVPAMLVTLVVVYAAAIVYLAGRTPVQYHARMFVPLLPLLLLIVARWLDGQVPRRAALASLAAYAVVNAVATFSPPENVTSRDVTHLLAPVAPWISAHVPADAVLLATEGQLTGYVLARSTVSVVEPRYSVMRWTEPETREVARRFGVGWVIVYPGRDAPGIFGALSRGEAPPWLELATAGAGVRVYRVR